MYCNTDAELSVCDAAEAVVLYLVQDGADGAELAVQDDARLVMSLNLLQHRPVVEPVVQ